MDRPDFPSLEDPSVNANHVLAWLLATDPACRVDLAQAVFQDLLEDASRPRSSSTQACTRLCGFVQQCMKSGEAPLRDWAFSEQTALALFDLYIEWNEKDQHRSMKLILDLLTASMTQSFKPDVAVALKSRVLESLVSIASRQSTRPLVKSSMGSLNHLIVKSVLSLDDVADSYRRLAADATSLSPLALWRHFVAAMFSWMQLSYVCPVAGKFLVTLFRGLYGRTLEGDRGTPGVVTASILHEWLQEALANNAELLESIKNYILIPLFRADRTMSVELLHHLNRVKPLGRTTSQDLDTTALLQLAALDAGKKCALVEDPNPSGAAPQPHVVVLKEEVLEDVLTHPSRDVRLLAMSLLITHSASTRPYSLVAMKLLQKHLGPCHTDHDAKFRNEILGYSKDMVKRVKAVTAVLQRQLSQVEDGASNPDQHTPANRNSTAPKKSERSAKKLSAADVDSLREALRRHEAFSRWYLDFLKSELVPTASYQRHITALRALLPVMKREKQVVGHESLDPQSTALVYLDYGWIRAILDRVMDPFDDVRETAVAILALFPPEATQTEVEVGPELPKARLVAILREFCIRASNLASRTARADHADGVARSYGVLCSWLAPQEDRLELLSQVLDVLEGKISRAEKDLGHAAIEEPVHGDFAALGYIWEMLAKGRYGATDLEILVTFQRRIVQACDRIWNAVSYVLCDDSPEGHLPEEMEDVDGLDTKDLLSYSFRAVHESSNLMRTIVGVLRLSRTAGMLLPSEDVFSAIGNLTFQQLSTLRHRGAFSTVSLTFTTCCQVARDPHVSGAGKEGSETLLDAWYQGTLRCIYEQASTTRRSAGIPALMAGILASNAPRPSFSEVMRMLQAIAQEPARVAETDGSHLPQVHAFNCIKEVFKSSLLNKKAEAHLPECLQLAIGSLRSEVWAIRNCALLLLRSLIDCLFGTGESKSSMEAGWDGKTVRLSYAKHPMLPSLLASLLESGEKAMEASTWNSAAESVFPALEIIRRGGPPDDYRQVLYDLIAEYLGSHLWHVREMAARTLCAFLLHGDFAPAVQKLLGGPETPANRLHGVLLMVRFLLERKAELAAPTLQDDVATISSMLKRTGESSPASSSPEVQAAYIEVLNLSRKLVLAGLASPAAIAVPSLKDAGPPGGITKTPSALLRDRLAVQRVQDGAISGDIAELRSTLDGALYTDVNTATAVLEAAPATWGDEDVSDLVRIYARVATETSVPDLKAPALANLAGLMYNLAAAQQRGGLPSTEALAGLKASLGRGPITPYLSQAIIHFSGAVMAAEVVFSPPEAKAATDRHLREWGEMMSDALDDGNTFDTRHAAASTLSSFARAAQATWRDPAYLPLALALYDALNDDDDEIRDAGAAGAAAVVLRQSLVPVEAARALLGWMAAAFGRLPEFRRCVAARMTGRAAGAGAPARLLEAALRVDDELFAVEEPNLWVDEVRETRRWAGVLAALDLDARAGGGEAGPAPHLGRWAAEALRALLATVASRDDGPLGWSSKPEAFALCARAILCGRALAAAGGDDAGLSAALGELREVGGRRRLHGLLLGMLRGDEEEAAVLA